MSTNNNFIKRVEKPQLKVVTESTRSTEVVKAKASAPKPPTVKK